MIFREKDLFLPINKGHHFYLNKKEIYDDEKLFQRYSIK
jgi:hypothetical protein